MGWADLHLLARDQGRGGSSQCETSGQGIFSMPGVGA